MTDYLVTDTELTNVANAIRAKGGTVADLEWPTGYIAAINAIPTGGVTIVDWATGTDAEIAAMIDAAHNGDIDLQQDGGWAVGDVRTIHIDAFVGGDNNNHVAQDIDIVITSFDNYMSCGNVMQFDFLNVFSETQNMNSQNTNVGGYGGSEMKTVTLPALYNAMPGWMKSRMIDFSVLVSSGNRSTTIETITGNKLALRSEIEVYGRNDYSASGEGSQLSYYTIQSNRKKSRKNESSFQEWFLRSPNAYNTTTFVSISGNGASTYPGGASYNRGLAPFGCL